MGSSGLGLIVEPMVDESSWTTVFAALRRELLDNGGICLASLGRLPNLFVDGLDKAFGGPITGGNRRPEFPTLEGKTGTRDSLRLLEVSTQVLRSIPRLI